jgi:hypothetical protein
MGALFMQRTFGTKHQIVLGEAFQPVKDRIFGGHSGRIPGVVA